MATLLSFSWPEIYYNIYHLLAFWLENISVISFKFCKSLRKSFEEKSRLSLANIYHFLINWLWLHLANFLSWVNFAIFTITKTIQSISCEAFNAFYLNSFYSNFFEFKLGQLTPHCFYGLYKTQEINFYLRLYFIFPYFIFSKSRVEIFLSIFSSLAKRCLNLFLWIFLLIVPSSLI